MTYSDPTGRFLLCTSNESYPASLEVLNHLPVNLLPESWPLLGVMATGVALDCVLDVTFAIIQIVLFLYYWQAVHPKLAVDDADVR